MGILVPDDFQLASLANDAERVVVDSLCRLLSDGWVVLPNVGLTGQRDRQMDIVIAHADDGVAVIEVKGHRAKIAKGTWCCDGSPMKPQPLEQARGNAYALRSRLRSLHPTLAHVDVEYAVAFPNIDSVIGDLPTDVHPTQILTSRDLETLQESIDRLMCRRFGGRIGAAAVEMIVQELRPDADLHWDPEARARLARSRLRTICGDQVRALESLDMNRRVLVTGGAGSGKTRLAMGWARRAIVRDERVLLTCYNDPLGGEMERRLPDDAALAVGAFLRLALELEGMPPLEIPDDADSTWWDHEAVGHLLLHWHEVTDRFDTIIVDEAQDFSPAWLAQLAQLLDPDGPRRLLMVADVAQGLYPRGFRLPAADDGWVRCELANNCRNTQQIATLLHERLGGAPSPQGRGPETEGVDFVEANNVDQLIELVGEEIDRIVDQEGHAPPRVLVATFSSETRDALRASLALVAWEGGASTAIICENVHRVKGLEFDYVVLAAADNLMSDALLYVGVSRAVTGLTVIGPTALATRLGLTH